VLKVFFHYCNWFDIKNFAGQIHFKVKPGSLSAYGYLKHYYGLNEQIRFKNMRFVLTDEGIESDAYKGSIRCVDKCYSKFRYRINMAADRYNWEYPGTSCRYSQVAVLFN